jgi:endonuclease/exonuclease/phosphatase family metal-dependent hydrolase
MCKVAAGVKRNHSNIAVRFLSLAVAAVMAHGALGEAVDLRIMSFNVRYSKTGFGESATENNWNDAKFPRRERAIRVIRENLPDLVGVQEARDLQVNDLRGALPDYEFYGIGRDDGNMGGEFSGIFYRKGRFTQKRSGSFWLSATPEKPGTSFYTAIDACPRIASWVLLTDKKSGRDLVMLYMHWDHISVPAR